MAFDFINILFLSIIGFVISFIGGLVGLVLGVIRLPFILSMGLNVTDSVGTNIGVSTMGAIIASIQHIRKKNTSFKLFIIMASTGAVGAFLGALLTKHVPITFFLILIGLIIPYESFTLLKDGSNRRKTNKDDNIGNDRKDTTTNTSNLDAKSIKQKNLQHDVFMQSVIGFFVGVLGGLVGLVLGSIRLPAMIKILKTEPKIAVGTNMLVSSVMGISGFVGHIINNEVNFLYLAILGPSAMIGGFIGARYTDLLRPSTLKKMIGIVLAIVGAVIFISPIIGFNILYS